MTAIQAPALHTSTYRLTFLHQLRSELIKLVTVRGTWWSVIIAAVLTIGMALAIAATMTGPGDAIMAVVAPVQFTMMLAGILGVISVTGEYSTGMIRSTLTAAPVRGMVLAAKSVVLGGFMFIVSLLISLAAAIGITPLIAANDLTLDWADPSKVITPILAVAGAMALFALLGVALGFVLRSGAGAIAVTVGILFVLPIIVSLFGMFGPGAQWIVDLGEYLPSAAVQSAVMPSDEWGISVPAAWATLVAWPAAALLGAWAVLRGRDA